MEAQGKAILIKPEEIPDTTNEGIFIPGTVSVLPNVGTVIKAGPGCENVKVGDRVQYARKGASVMTVEDEDLHWIIEDQIFYIYG